MTSRIQGDGDRKAANWADIDDDEDDWAPETIEWNDGTKITLTQTESVAPQDQRENDSKETTQPSATLDYQSTERESSKTMAPKTPSSLGPNATVLRVGGHAEKQQLKPSNDSSKGTSEKPTLVSKNAGRSPWAPLPPVDKTPPVAINPPSEGQRVPRSFQTERPMPGPMPGPMPEPPASGPLPAREIAADDFDRSWRDNKPSGPRELFNSQSGRYEPVGGRRGQSKNEQIRPSSLLQRPAHHESTGPAEPSAAFQTNRTSSVQEGGSWSRRRASSSVSGGAGSFGRRMSISKPGDAMPTDVPPPRRDFQQNQVAERPVSPSRRDQQNRPQGPQESVSNDQINLSPNLSYRMGADSRYSPPSQPPAPAEPSSVSGAEDPSNQAPAEDPVAVQNRIMREKVEVARQRRKEQEEKEEAEKQERIRLRLEAMGPAPTKQAHAAPEPTKQQPAPDATIQSPPKPPVPEPSGEPKQYGMMKVHHPESVKKLVGSNEKGLERPPGPGSQDRRLSSPKAADAEAKSPEHGPNGGQPSKEPLSGQTSGPHAEPQTDDKHSQWKAPMPTPAAFPSWAGAKLGANNAPAPSLWGPPNADRALGNGTFDRHLTSFPPQDIPTAGTLSLSDQLPVGSTPAYNDRIGAPERLQASLQGGPKSMADNGQPASPLHSPEKRQTRLHSPENLRPISRPGPIAPPSAAHGQKRQVEQLQRNPQQTAAWQNFHSVASRADTEENAKFQRELAASREEEARTGVAPSLQVSFKETWRQVDPGNQAGQRNIIGVTTSSDKGRESPLASLQDLGSPAAGLSFPHEYSKPSTAMPARGSRFFPQSAEQPRQPPTQDTLSASSPSPPPPEELSSFHPVYTGDSHRPLVHLPTPKPRVKLPPGKQSPPASFSSVAAAPAAPSPLRAHARPIASTSVWQDRFNGLFGKKPNQSKSQSLAVTSASKEPLDVQPSTSPAAVSLPRDDLRDAGKVTTKDVEEEEEIFEDREAGSLPVVSVPIRVPVLAWQPPPSSSEPRFRPKYQRPVQSLSIEPYAFGQFAMNNTGGAVVLVHLPGSGVTKSLPWPTKREGNPAPRQRGNHGNRHRRGARSRDTTSSQRGPQNTKKAAPVNTPAASSRPAPHNGNWASRVAGANA